MIMKTRHKRFIFIGVALAAVIAATVLIGMALRSNISYFYTPVKVVSGEAPRDAVFRLGGMVVTGSLQRDSESIRISFKVTDNVKEVPVVYDGILPDLFSEGRGVVAKGRLDHNGVFVAEEVLAKHDESYMPKELKDAMQEAGAKGYPDYSKGN
jgi:cytochrome c-type biogenesis protein CcmE